jgi:hypothetical protein
VSAVTDLFTLAFVKRSGVCWDDHAPVTLACLVKRFLKERDALIGNETAAQLLAGNRSVESIR